MPSWMRHNATGVHLKLSLEHRERPHEPTPRGASNHAAFRVGPLPLVSASPSSKPQTSPPLPPLSRVVWRIRAASRPAVSAAVQPDPALADPGPVRCNAWHAAADLPDGAGVGYRASQGRLGEAARPLDSPAPLDVAQPQARVWVLIDSWLSSLAARVTRASQRRGFQPRPQTPPSRRPPRPETTTHSRLFSVVSAQRNTRTLARRRRLPGSRPGCARWPGTGAGTGAGSLSREPDGRCCRGRMHVSPPQQFVCITRIPPIQSSTGRAGASSESP